jgi:hypothetical protein
MPIDFYPQKSLEDLLTILDGLQKRQTSGTLTEVSATGMRTVKTIVPGNSRVETEILRVLWSMHVRAKGTEDANKYPNPYASRIRRTRPRYSGAAFS